MKPFLVDNLTESATKFPDSIALVDGSLRLSYSALVEDVEKLAIQLSGNPQYVGIHLPKSAAYVTAIYASLKAGHAYVPLDIEAPRQRLEDIANQAQFGWLITAKDAQAPLSVERILETYYVGDLTVYKLKQPQPASTGASHVLFTSGSTGIPKGVIMSHEATTAFVDWSSSKFLSHYKPRVLAHAPFHFDLSTFDLFATFKSGGTLVICNEQEAKQPLQVAELIKSYDIDTLYTTPTALQLLQQYAPLNTFKDQLKTVLFAGESFPMKQFKLLQQDLPLTVLINLYGPSETNVVTYHQVEPGRSYNVLPIGKPTPYATCKIEDNELRIGGVSLALEYLNNPEETRAKFLRQGGTRFYKSGDTVSEEEGELIFKGRLDRMVKRRGYRIEMGDIEAGFAVHPDISQLIALAIEHADGKKIILFYATWTKRKLGVLGLKQFGTSKLPSYMLPDKFVHCEEFPTNSNHKIDAQALIAAYEG